MRAWRIGTHTALPCIIVGPVAGAQVEVRSSTFAKETKYVNAEDVFTDRDACRQEIQRRKLKPAEVAQ